MNENRFRNQNNSANIDSSVFHYDFRPSTSKNDNIENNDKIEIEILRQDLIKHQIEQNNETEAYETKLLRFNEFLQNDETQKQEIFDLRNRLELATKKLIDQKIYYSEDRQKIINEASQKALELQNKTDIVLKKIKKLKEKNKIIIREKYLLEQEKQIMCAKLQDILKLSAQYHGSYFEDANSLANYLTTNISKKEKGEIQSNKLDNQFIMKNSMKMAGKIQKREIRLETENFQLKQENNGIKETNKKLSEENKKLVEEIKCLKTTMEQQQNNFSLNMLNLNEKDIKSLKIKNKMLEIEKDEEKDENQRNESKIQKLCLNIIKLKNSVSRQEKINYNLTNEINLKDEELRNCKNSFLELEKKFVELKQKISATKALKQKTLEKYKKRFFDLTSTIENLHHKITTLRNEKKEIIMQKNVRIARLNSELLASQIPSFKSSECSSSCNSSYNCNSSSISSTNFENDFSANKSSNFNINRANENKRLDDNFCIDESVPKELVEPLKQIIENNEIRYNLKLRLITKAICSYFNNVNISSDYNSNKNIEILREFIQKLCIFLLNDYTVTFDQFLENDRTRNTILKKIKEMKSIMIKKKTIPKGNSFEINDHKKTDNIEIHQSEVSNDNEDDSITSIEDIIEQLKIQVDD